MAVKRVVVLLCNKLLANAYTVHSKTVSDSVWRRYYDTDLVMDDGVQQLTGGAGTTTSLVVRRRALSVVLRLPSIERRRKSLARLDGIPQSAPQCLSVVQAAFAAPPPTSDARSPATFQRRRRRRAERRLGR